MTNIAGSGSGSIRQRHGSADPDPDMKQLQQFGEFLQAVPTRYCIHVAALTNALKGDSKTLEWPLAAAFQAAKGALAAAVPLEHPAPNAVLSLATEASDTHVAGVLQQLAKGSWQPLAFYTKKMSWVGTRYSTFDRELLVAFSAIQFSFCWRGGAFAFSQATNPWSQPCSTPRCPGRPANSDSCFSLPNLLRTSGTCQDRRTWSWTP
jgi:hypothetical protein